MRRRTVIAILIVLFLVQAIPLVLWIRKDTAAPAWDDSWHLMIGLYRYRMLFDRGDPTISRIESVYPMFRFAYNYFPPLYHTAAIPLYALFGTAYDSALYSNIFFLIVLLFSVYAIGKKLHNREAGLFAAFVCSTVPIYSYFMRHYLLDFALSAMVALGLALLLYTDRFRNMKYSVLFGIAFGLGLLTKWSYPVFLVVPIISAFFGRGEVKVRIRNILLFLICAAVVSSLWYTPARIGEIWPYLFRHISSSGIAEGDPAFNTLRGCTYYLFAFIEGFSFLYFVIFACVAAVFIKDYKQNRMFMPHLMNIAAIYGMFTFGSNKDPRFIIPIYAILAVVSAAGICAMQNRLLKQGAIVLIVLLGTFQNIAYNSEAVNVKYKIGNVNVWDTKGRYPSKLKIDIDKLLRVIENDRGTRDVSVCIVAESRALNDINLPYYAIKGGYHIAFMKGGGENPLLFDYTIEGPIDRTWRSDAIQKSLTIIQNSRAFFEPIYHDGEVTIYRLSQ